MMLIVGALRDLIEKHHETSAEFGLLAENLRNGGQMAFWAKGEAGVVAADKMKEEFIRLANNAAELVETLEDYEFDEMLLSQLYRD